MLQTPYEEYIHISRYARWDDKLNRRETWPETVKRYCDFFSKKFNGAYDDTIYNEIQPAILNCEVMPSMRALMTAGPALERENMAGYNCAYVSINHKRAFSETLYSLMCGTGIGFTCERQEVGKLPTIPENLKPSDDVIVVEDSKMGWAKAYNKLINALYDGDIPSFDLSKVRPAGARLKTFGGRASGPEPLRSLFEHTIEAFKKAKGRKLNSIEVHGIICKIADIVVVGGVRRSALLSLSNLSDQRMRDAKSGQWWHEHPEYALANNSIAYTEKPEMETFMEEWLALVKSKSGERGIFNRVAAQKQASKWGKRSAEIDYGCNP
jgi:ribonucleoside-diphosphate reductase alpha chain